MWTLCKGVDDGCLMGVADARTMRGMPVDESSLAEVWTRAVATLADGSRWSGIAEVDVTESACYDATNP